MKMKNTLLLTSTLSLIVLFSSNNVMANNNSQTETGQANSQQEHKSYRASKKKCLQCETVFIRNLPEHRN